MKKIIIILLLLGAAECHGMKPSNVQQIGTINGVEKKTGPISWFIKYTKQKIEEHNRKQRTKQVIKAKKQARKNREKKAKQLKKAQAKEEERRKKAQIENKKLKLNLALEIPTQISALRSENGDHLSKEINLEFDDLESFLENNITDLAKFCSKYKVAPKELVKNLTHNFYENYYKSNHYKTYEKESDKFEKKKTVAIVEFLKLAQKFPSDKQTKTTNQKYKVELSNYSQQIELSKIMIKSLRKECIQLFIKEAIIREKTAQEQSSTKNNVSPAYVQMKLM